MLLNAKKSNMAAEGIWSIDFSLLFQLLRTLCAMTNLPNTQRGLWAGTYFCACVVDALGMGYVDGN